MLPVDTVAVNVTRVCDATGELAGVNASVVVVAVCARIIFPGRTTATRRRTIRIRQRNPQEQKSFICIPLTQVLHEIQLRGFSVFIRRRLLIPTRRYCGEIWHQSDSRTPRI
jgi:hypothetical protein